MEAAYAAGYMDGEGTIRLFVRSRRERKEIQMEVALHNTHRDSLMAIQAEYGGSLKLRNGAGRPIYRLTWGKKSEVREFLEKINPFLIIKQPQAELMLEFLKRHDEKTRARQTERDFEIVAAIGALNAESRWRD